MPATDGVAGVDIIRRVVYFDGHGISGPVLVIAIYMIGGSAAAIVASSVQGHRRERHAAATPIRPGAAITA